MELTNPVVWGVPFFIALIVIEILYSRTHGNEDLYQWKDLFASTGMGVGAAILGPIVKILFTGAIFFGTYELFNPEVNGVRTNILGYESFGWAWYVWIICQFLDDFTYYWFHRLNHTVRFLWAAHIVHHSSSNFNFGTGIRNGWITLLYKPLFYMWLPAIGFHPEMVLVCLGIETLWQFQLHTKYVPKLGFLDKFLNTHTQHQVHHARNLEYLDKNHGGYLNLFDKVFGSWKEYDEDIEIEFGVVHEPNSYNPIVILSHEYKDIWNDVKNSKNLYEAFMYTFGEPGWAPGDASQTVKQMQRAMKKEQKKAKAA